MLSRRRLGRRVLAMLLGTAVAFGAAEFVYRWTRLSKLSPTTHPGYVAHDDELGWCYHPNARGRHTSAEFDVPIAINAQGFRGPDWPRQEPGRPLVLLVGDSMVFGWGVQEEDTLCGLLRRRHPQWDVRNAGISGFAPDQQLLLVRRLLRQVRPRVVVCVASANDVYEVANDVMYGLRKPRFVCDGARLRLLSVPGAEPLWHRHSLLLRALSKMWWTRRFARTETRADWDLLFALYRALRADVGDAACILAAHGNELAAFAQREPELMFLDLGAVLPADGTGLSFPQDGHWTAAGHARVAAALAPLIEQALDKAR
jgi:lysophospholipase L1-like esterase